VTANGEPAARLPFDPKRVAPSEDDRPAAGKTPDGAEPLTLSVSQLTRLIRGAIKRAIPGTVHVVGELSNVSPPTGGHLYFTLKDAGSEIRCAMWRSSTKSLRFEVEDGLKVVASGEVDVYEPRGQVQLYVRRLEPHGIGALDLAFRQLRQKLASEGLFDPARKRPLPKFPRCVAVVTSPTGAAVRDVLQTIARRYPCATVLVFGVRVQGEGAAEEIADAIRRLNRHRDRLGGIDAMIVGRGGGSLEDLWAFNEEVVARAISASEIPIVSAVGHETDFTIADLVADVRAATPTAAAEIVVPDRMELQSALHGTALRLTQAVRGAIETAKSRLTVVQRYEWFRDPIGRLRHRQQAVDEVQGRLQLAVSRCAARQHRRMNELEVRLAKSRPELLLSRRTVLLDRAEHRLRTAIVRLALLPCERRLRDVQLRYAAVSPDRLLELKASTLDQLAGRLTRAMDRLMADRSRDLEALSRRVAAASHEQVLNRGFTITRRLRDGKIIRRGKDVRLDDRVETQTVDGKFTSRVVDGKQGELFE